MEYSPKKMQDLLNQNDFKFKKKYGQNFIIDENTIHNIIEKAQINSDALVIEIGPGAGSLTVELCKKAKQVLCYEIDSSLKEILNKNLENFSNVDILYQDFLKSDVKKDIQKYTYSKIYLVANLPYYITTPIIMSIIEKQIPIDKIVVMVQKEVGDRFKAKAGTKEYGSLTVFLNYYYSIKKLMDVSRNVFLPKPNVDSIVVEFTRKNQIIHVENEIVLFELIKDSFKQKRKTLKNNLKGYDLEKIDNALKKHKMDLNVRAEQISLDLFIEIANRLVGEENGSI